MTLGRIRNAAAAMLIATAVSGCGLGAGEGAGGEAAIKVTRDYGQRVLLEEPVIDPAPSDTVIRVLDEIAEIETRFSGGFVQAIEGVEAGREGGRSFDWFFYVNGIESPVGAAEVEIFPGDRVWWDFRDWTDAMAVPAVVGDYPEPFLHGSEGRAFPVRVDCLGESADCSKVLELLGDQGVPANLAFDRARIGSESIRVVVGPWSEVAEDTAAGLLDDGPSGSGVFAGFEQTAEGTELVGLDVQAEVAERFGAGTGLIAAVRLPDQQPTWLLTGVDQEGVERAVAGLDPEVLEDNYAVALPPSGEAVGLPLGAGRR